MKNITIRDIKTIITAPHGINLVVVKVETSEPELYGLGCATFTWRYKAVIPAIQEYLRPMLIGRSVYNTEDIWQTMMGSSYWRNGPVLNNAISGVDEALWDIKGKIAGLPLYELFGGKCREGIAVYKHADGNTVEEVVENLHALQEQGYHYIRCQMGTYGGTMNGAPQKLNKPENAPDGMYYSPRLYMQNTVKLFEKVRNDVGWDVELLHDIHERLTPIDTLNLVKEFEQFKMFYVEDALRPDQVGYFEKLRSHTTTPLAMGELFTNSLEWKTIIQNQWIDYIRVHISDIGGLTPARKLAAFSEAYQVRTAWHGPNDLSPVGMTAQMHLDLSSSNFGIQEFAGFNEAEEEVFPGCPEVRNGYAYLNDKPGIGVDFDEEKAKKYPAVDTMDFSWLYSRIEDGTAVRP